MLAENDVLDERRSNKREGKYRGMALIHRCGWGKGQGEGGLCLRYGKIERGGRSASQAHQEIRLKLGKRGDRKERKERGEGLRREKGRPREKDRASK